MNVPSPHGHGWTIADGELSITWMTRQPAPSVLVECISCACKVKKCVKGRCSCLAAELPCTDLCKCKDYSNFKDDDVVSVSGTQNECEDDFYDESL